MSVSPTTRIVITDQSESCFQFEMYQMIKSQSLEKFHKDEFLPRYRQVMNDKSLTPVQSLTQRIKLVSMVLEAFHETKKIEKHKDFRAIESIFLNQKASLLKERKQEGDLDKAIILFKQVIELDNTRNFKADAYSELGQTYQERNQKGDVEAAKESFQQAAKLAQSNPLLKEKLKENDKTPSRKQNTDASERNTSQNSIDLSSSSHSSSSSSTIQERHTISISPSFSSISSRGIEKCLKAFEEGLVKWKKKEQEAIDKQKICIEKDNGFVKGVQSFDKQIAGIDLTNEKFKRDSELLEGKITEIEKEIETLRSEMIKKITDTKEIKKILELIVKKEKEIESIRNSIKEINLNGLIKQKEDLQLKKKKFLSQQQESITELEKCKEEIRKCSQKIEKYTKDLNLFKRENESRRETPFTAYLGLGSLSTSLINRSSSSLTSESNSSRKRKLSSSSDSSSNSSSSSSSSQLSPSPIKKQKEKRITEKLVSKKSKGKTDGVGIDKEMEELNEKNLSETFMSLYQKIKSLKSVTLDDIKTYFSENKVDEKSYHEGWSVLHFLVKYKQVSALKEFLETYHPDIRTEDGWNALQIICMDNAPNEKTKEIIEILVKKYGPEIINLENSYGINSFNLAVYYENAVAVKAMITHVKDLTQLDKDGFGAVHYACMGSTGKTDVIKILMEHASFDIELRASNGRTPIMMAASFLRENIVKEMLLYNSQRGKKEYLKDNNGYTAVDYVNGAIQKYKKMAWKIKEEEE